MKSPILIRQLADKSRIWRLSVTCLVVLLVTGVVVARVFPVKAEQCDNPGSINETEVIRQCIQHLNDLVSSVSGAHVKNKADLQLLQQQVVRMSGQIKALEGAIAGKQEAIGKQDKAFDSQLETLGEAVRSVYIRSQTAPTVATVVFGGNLDQAIWEWGVYQTAIQRDRDKIVGITDKLNDLRAQKQQLEDQQRQAEVLKTQVDAKAKVLAAEVAKVEEAIGRLEGQIDQLSARQQEILAAKTGFFTTSVGEVPEADDPASRPDYNPGFSPAFAAFSFGAPHFKGMSQYGAWGRAKSGQNAEQILSVYYGGGVQLNKGYSTAISITVQGYGTFNIEDYVKRIYEMPGSWTENNRAALMAQAVAARSYALAYTNNGAGSICATEACQVFRPAEKGGDWNAAVEATRGWVLTVGGRPFSAWYASTSGGYQESYTAQGYSTPGFWDTVCGSQGCWTGDAYEKKAGSPWFYKGWYRTRSGSSCGRGNPWLSSGEFADIINALLVYTHDSGSISHLSQTDAGSCWGSAVQGTWSRDEVSSRAGGYGGPVSEIRRVSATYATNGVTASVHVETDKGGFDFNGGDFKLIFNLRAPAAVHLTSGLFNIEKK